MNRSVLVVYLCLIICLIGCGTVKKKMSVPTAQELEIQILRVGVDPDYPPIIFKKNGVIKGIEADLAEQLGQHLGIEIQFIEIPFKELITELNRGKIDLIMSGMSAVEKRKGVVQFTEPYMTVGQVVIVLASNKNRYAFPRDALYENGLRIGCESKTSGMTFAANQTLLAEIIQFDSVASGLEGLRKGEIFAFVHDSPTGWQIASDPAASDLAVLTKPLTQEPLAWALHKEKKDLARLLNKTMREWKKSGKVNEILSKWLPPEAMTK
jgi:ABC-type amino acid transport substrate-binding protein